MILVKMYSSNITCMGMPIKKGSIIPITPFLENTIMANTAVITMP